MKSRGWLLLVLLLAMAGCTKSGVDKRYDITANSEGNQLIFLALEATTDTDTESGDASIPVTPTAAIGMQGSTASTATQGAELFLDQVKSAIEAWQDNRKKDSDNTVTPAPTPAPVPTPTPVPTPEPEPQEPVTETDIIETINNTGATMSFRDNTETTGVLQDLFVFPKLGPEYGESFKIVAADGRELLIKDSTKMHMLSKAEGYMKYQPGGKYTVPENEDIPTMQVYAARGTHPAFMSIVALKSDDPDFEKVVTIIWQGNPNAVGEDRSRCWWTDTGGNPPGERDWQYKFPLAKSALPGYDWNSKLKFVFEDGNSCEIPNGGVDMVYCDASKKIKFREAEPSNVDPCKRDAKIAAASGSKPKWVKVYYGT